jgi:hypothetical protein
VIAPVLLESVRVGKDSVIFAELARVVAEDERQQDALACLSGFLVGFYGGSYM